MPEEKHQLKVFPSAGSGHRLYHAHADRDPVRALPEGARLTKDGVDAWLADKINIASKGTLRAKNPLIRYAIR